MVIPGNIKLLIIFIHVQLMAPNERLESHINLEFIVWMLQLLLEQSWV
jgi:hypothetical protein